MTLAQILDEITAIRSLYPPGTEPHQMEPEHAHRLLHLRRAARQKAASNQQTMTALLSSAARHPGRQTYTDLPGLDQPHPTQSTMFEPRTRYTTDTDRLEDLAGLAARADQRSRADGLDRLQHQQLRRTREHCLRQIDNVNPQTIDPTAQ